MLGLLILQVSACFLVFGKVMHVMEYVSDATTLLLQISTYTIHSFLISIIANLFAQHLQYMHVYLQIQTLVVSEGSV